MTASNSYQCSCIECKQIFANAGIHTHYIRAHTNLSKRNTGKGTYKFTIWCSCTICKRQLTAQNIQRHVECNHLSTKQKKICKKCGNTHAKSGVFCSHSCANSKKQTAEANKKRSVSLLNIQRPAYTKISKCVICSKYFEGKKKICSPTCKSVLYSNASRKSDMYHIRRSKDEIALFELCNKYYTTVTANEKLFNGWDADILIHDIRVAILWNGPWHYKTMPKLKHSLLQVQNRDKIKINEIKKAGWTAIVYEDRYYTPMEAFNDLMLRTINNIRTLLPPLLDEGLAQ